jgi:cobalt/nickel transport system permease protein
MHLGNGAITPECAVVTFGAAAVGLGAAMIAARREPLSRGQWAQAGALCAAVFAAQMVNVPVLPFSSAHLVGGVLLAWCLGPALGTLSMTVILAVQALLLGDGGLAAWGANVINMALLPAGLVWGARRFSQRSQSSLRRILAAAVVSAGSVLLASFLIVGEISLFRPADEIANLGPFAARLVAAHAWIGLAEGLATCIALFALGALTPGRATRPGRWQLAGPATAALLLIACLPWASSLPDGYEAAAQQSGLASLLTGDPYAWQVSLQSALQCVLPGDQLFALGAMSLAALLAGGVVMACQFKPAPAPVTRRHAD